eukprot:c5602_g1_i2.p1 GENE.c5602_g1_i2~~c5602_g1_i2.p1  ORF type:complete len:268 (+),score=72.35 c5602_g1_i2:327-1130(+)
MLLAGGLSQYVCLYSTMDQSLLERFKITANLSVDGVLHELNSKDAHKADFADSEDSEDVEDRRRVVLPGAKSAQFSSRRVRRAAQTFCVKMSPSGTSFSCASTEGLLVYSQDTKFFFDPTDLDTDCTVDNIRKAIKAKQSSKALLMSLRLNEEEMISQAYYSVPPLNIPIVAEGFPEVFVNRLLAFIASEMAASRFVEYHLRWCHHLFFFKGNFLKQNSTQLLGRLRGLHKTLANHRDDMTSMCEGNSYTLQYILASKTEPTEALQT